jgi:hypothetical protein
MNSSFRDAKNLRRLAVPKIASTKNGIVFTQGVPGGLFMRKNFYILCCLGVLSSLFGCGGSGSNSSSSSSGGSGGSESKPTTYQLTVQSSGTGAGSITIDIMIQR